MRISVLGLAFLTAIFCTLPLTTLRWDGLCKLPTFSIICRHLPGIDRCNPISTDHCQFTYWQCFSRR